MSIKRLSEKKENGVRLCISLPSQSVKQNWIPDPIVKVVEESRHFLENP